MKRYKRKRINSRDLQQRQICKKNEFLVEHHIHGRNIPNPNSPNNLTYVCSNCHYKIHKGWFIIEGWFDTTNGRELIWHEKEEDSLTGENASVHLF